MASTITRLPDGQTFTVAPVFSGFIFKHCEPSLDLHGWPAGWTVVLHTEEYGDNDNGVERQRPVSLIKDADPIEQVKRKRLAFTNPTLENDLLFISSITNPSTSKFEPAASSSRQTAMMLWVTLYWYFHQSEPKQSLHSRKGWKIHIKREGLLQSQYLMPKLERMGIITSTSTAVGTSFDSNAGWDSMFVSRSIFWQLPSRLFLFKLKPAPADHIVTTPMSPVASVNHIRASSFGPYYSTSHLPTYFPPVPLLFISSNGIRHPVRPKPPRMEEIFYSRFIPSVGKYISFRVASGSPVPVAYIGPVGPESEVQDAQLCTLSDPALLQTWLLTHEAATPNGSIPGFLLDALSSEHSWPAVGIWDGIPFGYLEVYWVKEDKMGRYHETDVGEWDRGLRVMFVVESAWEEVPVWVTSLVHWSFTADLRTMNVFVEFGTYTERYAN